MKDQTEDVSTFAPTRMVFGLAARWTVKSIAQFQVPQPSWAPTSPSSSTLLRHTSDHLGAGLSERTPSGRRGRARRTRRRAPRNQPEHLLHLNLRRLFEGPLFTLAWETKGTNAIARSSPILPE